MSYPPQQNLTAQQQQQQQYLALYGMPQLQPQLPMGGYMQAAPQTQMGYNPLLYQAQPQYVQPAYTQPQPAPQQPYQHPMIAAQMRHYQSAPQSQPQQVHQQQAYQNPPAQTYSAPPPVQVVYLRPTIQQQPTPSYGYSQPQVQHQQPQQQVQTQYQQPQTPQQMPQQQQPFEGQYISHYESEKPPPAQTQQPSQVHVSSETWEDDPYKRLHAEPAVSGGGNSGSQQPSQQISFVHSGEGSRADASSSRQMDHTGSSQPPLPPEEKTEEALEYASQHVVKHRQGLGYADDAQPEDDTESYSKPAAASTDGAAKTGPTPPSRDVITALLAKFAQHKQDAQQQAEALATAAPPGWREGTRIPTREKARLDAASQKNLLYVKNKDTQERRRKLGLLPEQNQFQTQGGGYGNDSYTGGPRGAELWAGVGGGKHFHTSKPALGSQLKINASAYVTGLPPSVTQQQLELLFSAHGAVRKIKIYYHERGPRDNSPPVPKGDALIAFAKPGSVDTAMERLSGHALAPGYRLHITRAEFGHKEQAEDLISDGNRPEYEYEIEAVPEQQYVEQPPEDILPLQCEAAQYPVVVLRDVYIQEDLGDDPDQFFADLEADMLSECVKHGNVRSVVTPEGYYDGCVAVTFVDSAGAEACARTMHGRWFDSRQISVEIHGAYTGNYEPEKLLPPLPPEEDPQDEVSGASPSSLEAIGGYPNEQKEEEAPPVPEDLDSFLSSV